MDIFGWNGASLSDDELKSLRMSFYGQASICRWLSDTAGSGTAGTSLSLPVFASYKLMIHCRSGSGDVTGDDVGAVTRICRKIVMSRQKEVFIYMCILVAAIVSGTQSCSLCVSLSRFDSVARSLGLLIRHAELQD